MTAEEQLFEETDGVAAAGRALHEEENDDDSSSFTSSDDDSFERWETEYEYETLITELRNHGGDPMDLPISNRALML